MEGIEFGDRVLGMALGTYAGYCNVPPIVGDKPLLLRHPENVSSAGCHGEYQIGDE